MTPGALSTACVSRPRGHEAPRPGTEQLQRLLTGSGTLLLPFLLLSRMQPWLCPWCFGCGRDGSKRMPRSGDLMGTWGCTCPEAARRRGGGSRDALPGGRTWVLPCAQSWSMWCQAVQGCGIQARVRPWSWAPPLPQPCIVPRGCPVTSQQHCLALLLSCRELRGKGRGTGDTSLGHLPSLEHEQSGDWGKGKAPLPGSGRSCGAPSPRGRSGGRDSKSKQGFHHTSASSAMQPSPAHTDMQHRKPC